MTNGIHRHDLVEGIVKELWDMFKGPIFGGLIIGLVVVICLALSGCISADYTKVPDKTEFKFVMINEADIESLEITAPGWVVKATRISNKTAIDQVLGAVADKVTP